MNGKRDDRLAAAGALTMEIARLLRLVKSAAQPDGADTSALHLLVPLMLVGPMRLGELAQAKGADPSTVSRQAAQLVRAGLVSSEPDPADGRARQLALTPAGCAECHRLLDARSRALDDALRDWSDAKLHRFAEMFREFNARIEATISCPTEKVTT